MTDGIQGIGRGPMMPQMRQNKMDSNQKTQLMDILSNFDPNNFTAKDFKAMGEKLQQAGFGQTREIKNILERSGFNIDQFQQSGQRPMPGMPRLPELEDSGDQA